eukprot:m.188258 g.188258  ORF g.188258 m.188258 type:complete len:159 (+) comp18522_c0_seq2:187-663(+)
MMSATDAAGPNAGSAALTPLIDNIEELVEECRRTAVNTHSFDPVNQEVLFENINGIAKLLNAVDSHRFSAKGIVVSPEILRYVDEGKNPELLLRESFDGLETSSKSQRDTATAFADFGNELRAHIRSEWPEATSDVADKMQESALQRQLDVNSSASSK